MVGYYSSPTSFDKEPITEEIGKGISSFEDIPLFLLGTTIILNLIFHPENPGNNFHRKDKLSEPRSLFHWVSSNLSNINPAYFYVLATL